MSHRSRTESNNAYSDVSVSARYLKSLIVPLLLVSIACGKARQEGGITINAKDSGYRGIWYMNQPSGDEYVYKYSGGLGTYCAKHKPFAVYCEQTQKTYFCYGGTTTRSNRELLHMVSYYDHKTGKVPRPTILLNKKTSDAHDNPVISVDNKGYVWIFSTSHGTSRPSYIHKSNRPYDISEFSLIPATKIKDGREVPITNFSYMQTWHIPDHGFICFFTRYNYPADRTICFMTSPDGVKYSEWTRIAAIEKGHYQISAAVKGKAATAFNYHPKPKGLNWRTNLYYLETADFGRSWRSADGKAAALPLTDKSNVCLVHGYQAEGLKVYLKDIRFDKDSRPVILFITSKGYESGPKNDPRTWTTARWTGDTWQIRQAFTSDNNYDMGSLYIENDQTWRIIGPTQTGPQPYNPGGEMAMWLSTDAGKSWKMTKQLTKNSPRNHTYARRPVSAHPDFYAIWADGHGRQPSESTLHFCNKQGDVRALPRVMKDDFAYPPVLIFPGAER
ncbi:MAG: BNR-4 repeat-containing protein [Planctomycetota bacterium]